MSRHERNVSKLFKQEADRKRKAKRMARKQKKARDTNARRAQLKIELYLKKNGANIEQSLKRKEAVEMYCLYVGIEVPTDQNRNSWLLAEYKRGVLPGLDTSLPKKEKRPKKVKKKRKKWYGDYATYLKSEKWQVKRLELFALRGRKCETCSATKNIQVHHLHYRNIFDEKMEDLQALCVKCHRKVHEITDDNPKGNTKGVLLKKKRKPRKKNK